MDFQLGLQSKSIFCHSRCSSGDSDARFKCFVKFDGHVAEQAFFIYLPPNFGPHEELYPPAAHYPARIDECVVR